MNQPNNPSALPKELTITRLFDAPRALVFKAWTDPKHLAQWWGPHGYTNPVCTLDVRPGGALYIEMTGPDEIAIPNRGTFQEVVEPERLVFTTRVFEDEAGNPRLEVLSTITFAEEGRKTRLTMHALVLTASPDMSVALGGMEQGWNESLDRLIDNLQFLSEDMTMNEIIHTPPPHSRLKSLDRLVGTWAVSGPDITGQIRFEWLAGGFFLLQHVDFVHGGHHIRGLEIIGCERPFGATEASENITSRWYDVEGNTFHYTYEVDDETLTIWGGEKGSPAFYKGQWSHDGNSNAGAWVFPGGGGYDSTMTRIK